MDCNIVEKLLSRLHGVSKSGDGWKAKCPAHDDRHSSLSINLGDDGRALLHCHAGCTVEAVCAAINVGVADLFPPATRVATATEPAGRQQEPKFRRHEDDKPAKTFAKCQDAIAELEAALGRPSKKWSYKDAAGTIVGFIVRWDRPDGEEIQPISRRAGGWMIGGMPEPRPLYRLPELAAAKRVHVAEGEKAADAARSLGFVATTSPHGANSASKADWSPLAGKEVVILPDHDEAGEKYGDEVARLCLAAGAASVRILPLAEHAAALPAGGNIADVLADERYCGLPLGDSSELGDIRRHIERLAEAAPAMRSDTTQKGTARFEKFPLDALPEPVRGFVREGALSIGCNPAFVALPMLAALASAIGNTRRIALKSDWCEPSVLWTAIVGDSGTQKTPALFAGIELLHEKENEAWAAYETRKADYDQAILKYEAELADWKRAKSASRGDPPEQPDEPIAQRYVVSDATMEALADRLQYAPRGLLLARDELAGWLTSFNQYKSSKGGDVAHWLTLYNAKPLRVDRKTGDRKTTFVPVASVTIAGGIQPETLRRALGQEHFENGLAARLLLVYPPKRPRKWTEATVNAKTKRQLAFVFEQLLTIDFECASAPARPPRPKDLALTPAAKAIWIDFYNRHGGEQADLTGKDAALWSKLEGTAPRLALIIQLVREPSSDEVDEVSMAAGIRLADWFGAEGRRIYSILSEGDDERGRRELEDYIVQRGGMVSVRDLGRGPRKYRNNADAAFAALDDLVKRDRGRWAEKPVGPQGGRPAWRFELFSHNDGDETALNAGEDEVASPSPPDSDDYDDACGRAMAA